MLYLRSGANTQHVTGTSFLFDVYADTLAKHNQKVICGDKQFDATHLQAFAKQQVLTNSAMPGTKSLAIFAS